MTISINNGKIEARLTKALSKIPLPLRPSKQEFVETALNSYVDALVQSKAIPPV